MNRTFESRFDLNQRSAAGSSLAAAVLALALTHCAVQRKERPWDNADDLGSGGTSPVTHQGGVGNADSMEPVTTGGNAGAGGPGGGGGAAGSDTSGGTGGGIAAVTCQDDPGACTAMKQGLAHRYSFAGSGTAVMDSAGNAHGTLVGGALSGGAAVLQGGSTDQYVDLPNGIISALTSATFEAWVVWESGDAWQRIFDFGDNSNTCTSSTAGTANAEGQKGTCGRTYLFLTPFSSDYDMRVSYLEPGSPFTTGETRALTDTLQYGSMAQVAVVVDASAQTLTIYRGGSLAVSSAFAGSLSRINDINNWLGRSQFQPDPSFSGRLEEFRVYRVALTQKQVEISFNEGVDATFLN